jgi:hypothetical protein
VALKPLRFIHSPFSANIASSKNIMANKENQHYVPKFYLRFFSQENNLKEIGIYNIVSGFSFDKAPIKGQAYKPYFYGKDLTIEEWLSKSENITSFFFKDIIAHSSLPPNSINYKEPLLKFVLLFELRNPVEAENFEDSFNLFIAKFPDITKIPPDYKIKFNNPALIKLSLLDKALACCKDLKLKLLLNGTSKPFITSDNPMIKYNQFLERHKYYAGICGFGTKGLQIFIPISCGHMLVFYDSSIYKIGNKKDNAVFIVEENDIDQLNLLQCLNAYQIVFYNHFTNSDYIRKLMDKASKYQKPNQAIIEEVDNPKLYGIPNQKKGSRLIMHQVSELRVNLQLRFIKEISAAKTLSIDKTQYQMRDKALEILKYWR